MNSQATPPSLQLPCNKATPYLLGVMGTETETMPMSLELTGTEAMSTLLVLTGTEATPRSIRLMGTDHTFFFLLGLTGTEYTPPSKGTEWNRDHASLNGIKRPGQVCY